MPESEPESIVKLADIVECEILTTFANNAKASGLNFDRWGASYTITQNATETDDAIANPITWLSPAGVDKLLFSADAKYEREAYRNGKVEYSVFVTEKNSRACERVSAYKDIKVEPRDFKLNDWISQISHSGNYAQINNFSYAVRVQVTTGAGIGSDFSDKKWTAAGGLSRTRVSVKTVDFAFSPKPTKPEPLEVIVVAPIPERKAAPPETQRIVPRNRKIIVPPGSARPAIVPQSIIRENRSITQGQQLDRVSPNGILDR